MEEKRNAAYNPAKLGVSSLQPYSPFILGGLKLVEIDQYNTEN
jgi:hypothetical protein